MESEQKFITIAGGRITCLRCRARSKRTKQQCRAPAMKGKAVCRTHGGKSTGPKTAEGKQRCAEAKTIHGRETRSMRTERRIRIGELQELEYIGREIGCITGPKSRGPRVKLVV